jgi:hypothetical protein
MASRIKRITFTSELKTMTDKIKHLDYIQATITRMATVSFQIKTWNIGLVTAVFAFVSFPSSGLGMPTLKLCLTFNRYEHTDKPILFHDTPSGAWQ